MYFPIKFDIVPNGTELGDIMTTYDLTNGTNATFLRIKQYLDLPGNKYDYSATYVSNVSGSAEEFEFMGHTFSIAGMDGEMLDKMLKALLLEPTQRVNLGERPPNIIQVTSPKVMNTV